MENNKIIDLNKRRPLKLNIGLILAVVVVIYIVCSLIMFFSKDKVTVYEVNAGSLVVKNTYQGFIVREEAVKYAKQSGNINYFVREGQKIAVNNIVYSVDNSGKIDSIISGIGSDKSKLSESDIVEIKDKISNFKLAYNDNAFDSVYLFKSQLNENIADYLNENIMDIVSTNMDSIGNATDFSLVKNDESGVVVYGIDGYEDFKIDNINTSIFNKDGYFYNNLKNKEQVATNEAAYKVVTSEKWSIIIQLNDKQRDFLKNKENVNITFLKDNLSCNVPISVIENKTGYYGKLDFDKYMIRYVKDRYIDIEINESSVEGLKIPESAVVEKEFYLIPDTFYQSQASGGKGFVKVLDNGDFDFISPQIYYHKDNMYYVSVDDVAANTIIHNAGQQFTINEKVKHLGVFCLNKGYAVFKPIEILDSDEEYNIISDKTSYGLSLYDHIILDAKNINEEDIIY